MADHPLAERLDTFRHMSAQARRHAASATSPEMKQLYVHLADSWDELISEIVAVIEAGKR